MEALRAWFHLFFLGGLFFGLPIAVLLLLLGRIFKAWYIRWPLALGIWAVLFSQLPSPHTVPDWHRLQFEARTKLGHLYPALLAYQKDHGGQWPLQFSELVPDYISKEHLDWFFARTKLGQVSGTQKAAEQDLSEIDHAGLFVPLYGQGGMLAKTATPIIKRPFGLPWFQRSLCVILTTDGQVQTVTDQEYRQRFNHSKARTK